MKNKYKNNKYEFIQLTIKTSFWVDYKESKWKLFNVIQIKEYW